MLGDAQEFESRVCRVAGAMFPALNYFGADVEDVSENGLAGTERLADFLDLAWAHGLDARDFGDPQCDGVPLLSGDSVAKALHKLVENLDFLCHFHFPFNSATTARRAAFCFSLRSSC